MGSRIVVRQPASLSGGRSSKKSIFVCFSSAFFVCRILLIPIPLLLSLLECESTTSNEVRQKVLLIVYSVNCSLVFQANLLLLPQVQIMFWRLNQSSVRASHLRACCIWCESTKLLKYKFAWRLHVVLIPRHKLYASLILFFLLISKVLAPDLLLSLDFKCFGAFRCVR